MEFEQGKAPPRGLLSGGKTRGDLALPRVFLTCFSQRLDDFLAGFFSWGFPGSAAVCRPRHNTAWAQPVSLDDRSSLIIEDLSERLDDQTVVEIPGISDQNCGARFVTDQDAKTTGFARIVRRPDFYEPHVIFPCVCPCTAFRQVPSFDPRSGRFPGCAWSRCLRLGHRRFVDSNVYFLLVTFRRTWRSLPMFQSGELPPPRARWLREGGVSPCTKKPRTRWCLQGGELRLPAGLSALSTSI